MVAPANEFIPQDVTDDIFARLPIKSLIRFKSVSKPFLASLSDPAFARWHHHRSKSYKGDTKFLLLSTGNKQTFVVASCPRHDPNNPALSMKISNFDFPKKKYTEKAIIGSGDGLFCTYTDKKGIEVWNPSTRERRKLPDLGRPRYGGICYDPRIDDYKVVVFFQHNYGVFELKCKCWRMRIAGGDNELRSYYPRAPQPTEPIDGVIYWISRRGQRTRNGIAIYSFDLLKEELKEVTPPPDGDANFTLGVFHGCLCMVKYRVFKLWVMKEYGVWTELNFSEEGSMFVSLSMYGDKVFRFADGTWRRHSLHICNLGLGKPICVDDYDADDDESTCVGCASRITKVIQYSESLISPHRSLRFKESI